MTKRLNQVLALVLTIAALMTGQTAWAESTWSVSYSHNNANHVTTFTITRTETTYVQTVLYRTVSLTAYTGQHYTAVNGTLTFNAGEDTKTVDVQEKIQDEIDNAYRYQDNTTNRQYMLEVTDRAGFRLADCTRNKTIGTSINGSTAFVEQSVTVNSGIITVTDAGFTQAYHEVPMHNYYTAAASKGYLVSARAELRMKVEFEEAEENDGYQYIQILVNQTSDCDNSAKKKDPGTPDKSCYLASFEHDPSGQNATYAKVCFPLTSAGDNCNEIETAWNFSPYNNTVGKLYTQKFKDGYRHQSGPEGRLIIGLSNLTSVGIRFDAGGDDKDTWYARNTIAKIQAVDLAGPTMLEVSVNPGRHAKGNTVYVSVAFSEIVNYTGTRSLHTNWGDLSYVTGSGTNVLTFSGVIPQNAPEKFDVGDILGTVKDLSDHYLLGRVTASNLCSLDADFAYTLNDFQQDDSGNYLIQTHDDLWGLASYVNAGHTASGLTFLQVADIAFPHTTKWNDASSTENNYIAIGYHNSYKDQSHFKGNYDGGGHTISGIRIYKDGTSTSDCFLGLFGFNNGNVKRVNLADTRITGHKYIGGIAGCLGQIDDYGIIEDCTVGADVCIHAVANGAQYHGGITGFDVASRVRRCISRASLTIKDGLTGCSEFGGIAGSNSGDINDCIADGVVIPDVNGRGTIVSFSNGSILRNYYRGCKVAGVVNATSVGKCTENSTETSDVDGALPIYAITLGTNVTINRSPEATLPGTNNRTYTNGADINGQPYACAGATIYPNYSGELSTGYHVDYTTTAGAISANTLTMPAGAVTVSATVTANQYTGDGSANNPYLIKTADEWDQFASDVNGSISNSNTYFKLDDDIIVTTMVGSEGHRFCGHFDGGGKKLTLNYGSADAPFSEDYCAPFRYIENANIHDLTVDGTIYTSAKYAAGIAGNTFDVNKVIDCYSTVTINSSVSGIGNNGGFVGLNHGQLSFIRCAFLGSMLGSTAECNGGFVGWIDKGAKCTISQCIFDPINVTMSAANASRTFCCYDNHYTAGPNINTSYFTYTKWGGQGTRAVALTMTPANLGNVVSGLGTMTLYDNGLLCNGKYYVSNLGLYDNASNATLLSDADGKQTNVILTGRTLSKSGEWNTLCLPFNVDLTADGCPLAGATVKELDAENSSLAANGKLTLKFKDASSIEAGKPYIVKWTTTGDNIVDPVFPGVTVNATAPTAVTFANNANAGGDCQFVGQYSPFSIDDNNIDEIIMLGSGSTLGYSKNPRSLRSFRCHFEIPTTTNAPAMNSYVIDFGEGEQTGIISGTDFTIATPHSQGENSTAKTDSWYTLDGRKLDKKPTQKGMYIMNGRKVVIK